MVEPALEAGEVDVSPKVAGVGTDLEVAPVAVLELHAKH